MKPLNSRRLKEYERAYPDASASLRTWWRSVQGAQWRSFADVRRTFNSADQVGNRVIFNIKGNSYRLVAYIDYEREIVVMKWFGSHQEYDKGEWR